MNNNENICPICLDAFVGSTNQTITECGHHFHTKCLFQNISTVGYSCPYCRKDMTPSQVISVPAKTNENYIPNYLVYLTPAQREKEKYLLRGFRLLFQQNNNEELEPEYHDYYPTYTILNTIVNNDEPMAKLEDVIKEFNKANITNNQLIEYIYEDYIHEFNIHSNNKSFKKIYTKLRGIDANFRRNLRLQSNRNTDYYEDFVNEFQHAINESNNN
jgi:hypothetical protein